MQNSFYSSVDIDGWRGTVLAVMPAGKFGILQVLSSDHFQFMAHLDGRTALTQQMLQK